MHPTNNLQNFIKKTITVDDATAALIAEKYEWISLEKNELLIAENKRPKYNYLLEQGYVRSFTHNSLGHEVTTNIYTPFNFVNDNLAFFKGQPASESFQTLTNCGMWRISYTDVQTYFHSIPAFREFGRMMLVAGYAALNERMLGMIRDTAEQRYLKLMSQHTDIFQHVPLKIIASFLGITDTSLSRIRKGVAKH